MNRHVNAIAGWLVSAEFLNQAGIAGAAIWGAEAK